MESKKKIAIILGGGSGIGKAICNRFIREGWRVVITSHKEDQLSSFKEDFLKMGNLALKLDVRSERDLDRFKGELKDSQINRFDVLVNSIGVSEPYDAIGSSFKLWNNTIDVILYGTVRVCRLLVPLIQDGGRIINITSIHHNRVEKNSSAYGMAKAAVTQFTRSLALELASRRILVNAVAPGFVNTSMSINKDGINELETEWFHDNYIKYDHLPLRRAGLPNEVAGAVFFLAGDDSTYMTGSVITVDGGLTITF